MGKPRPVVGTPPEILLEVRPTAVSGELADSIGEVVEHFRSRLGKVLDRREETSWQVSSIEIEFDIAVRAEAGVVIAKASAGATFSTRLILQAPQDHSG
jgi:predicted sugar kinase